MTFAQKVVLGSLPVLGTIIVALIPEIRGSHSLVIAGTVLDKTTGAPVPPIGEITSRGDPKPTRFMTMAAFGSYFSLPPRTRG